MNNSTYFRSHCTCTDTYGSGRVGPYLMLRRRIVPWLLQMGTPRDGHARCMSWRPYARSLRRAVARGLVSRASVTSSCCISHLCFRTAAIHKRGRVGVRWRWQSVVRGANHGACSGLRCASMRRISRDTCCSRKRPGLMRESSPFEPPCSVPMFLEHGGKRRGWLDNAVCDSSLEGTGRARLSALALGL